MAQIAFGIGHKFFAAPGAAEKIITVAIAVSMLGRSGIDAHAADRVGGGCVRDRGVMRTR